MLSHRVVSLPCYSFCFIQPPIVVNNDDDDGRDGVERERESEER